MSENYSRRAYRMRDEQRDFKNAKVEMLIVIDGNTHSRLVVPDGSLFSVKRVAEGLDVDLITPGERVTDIPGEDPTLTRPERWQLDALRGTTK